MTRLEELYQAAHDDNIHIHNYKFSETKKAACVHCQGYKAIALNKASIESPTEEKILLAEEIAHYETGGLYMIENTYNTPLARINRKKCEAQAKRKTIEMLCPLEIIQSCIKKNITDIFEIAEILDLTPEYVSYAINMYVARNELSLVVYGD